MNDVEQATLHGYRLLCGKMTLDQALEEVYKQEEIIELFKPFTKCPQSVSKTKIATIRRDRFMNYALFLEKEEKESLAAK